MHKDFRWYMLYKFAILNTFLLGITGVGLMNGWVQELYLRDSTYMTNVIIAVFVLGWCLCGYKIWQTSRELNRAKQKEAVKDSRFIQHRINIKRAGPAGRADINEALKVKLFSRITLVSWIAGSLTVLGLIGTVTGFIIAMDHIDPEKAALVEQAAQMVAGLASGVGIAFSTTLVGAILNLFLYVNYLILANGTATLYASILEANADVG